MCFGQADFVESLELFEADGKELPGFWLSDRPCLRGRKEAFAVLAERKSGLLWDTFCDVDAMVNLVRMFNCKDADD